MSLILRNRVKSTTTTTGTGTITLGTAAAGYQAFSVIGNGNRTIYCITDNKDWEVGIGTYTSSGTTLSRDVIIESSNNNQKVDWSAGTKQVFVPFPTSGIPNNTETQGAALYGDTQLAWQNIRKYFINSYSSGSLFSSSSPVKINETISGGSGNNISYKAGILTPNGDIHFIPYATQRGRKWNVYTNSISTYSLVYTSTTTAAYNGGVLAPNGDVHFVPYDAPVGQKVSPNGVVSTYSLAYTLQYGYVGGILAPNGDIHYVPANATVGQKINSVTNQASTYSLLYTGTWAYSGAVLAPNGEIHFVPMFAPIGQKLDINGNPVLYGLAPGYTNFGDGVTPDYNYDRGVLAINGDIHFVPRDATFGMKVDTNTGIVSTYSILTNKHVGGVLAPDGSIHFIPYTGNIDASTSYAQKISIDGIVSTYSFTAGQTYEGGVLASDGAVYIPIQSGAASGNFKKLIFYPGIDIPMEVCLSPFFNRW